MRLLIHGMQSSGASTFTRVLAERQNCVALVDIPNNYAAPRVSTSADFVAKAVITTAYPLSVHVERFRPDKVILLLRDPRDNYESLRTKNYRHHSGLMEEKFQLLEGLFIGRGQFDAVIAYEDFVGRMPSVFSTLAALGWPISEENYRFHRSYDDLLGSLWSHEPDLQEMMGVVFGNVRGSEVTDKMRDKSYAPDIEDRVAQLCPTLLHHYRERASGVRA